MGEETTTKHKWVDYFDADAREYILSDNKDQITVDPVVKGVDTGYYVSGIDPVNQETIMDKSWQTLTSTSASYTYTDMPEQPKVNIGDDWSPSPAIKKYLDSKNKSISEAVGELTSSINEAQKNYNWNIEYNSMVSGGRPGKPKLKYYSPLSVPKCKENLTIKDALSAFRNLREKDINEFILTGSVALFIQGKISRDRFKDVDIISLSDYQMDDDMINYPRMRYEPIDGNGEQSSMVFNSVLFDVFKFTPETAIDTIEVVYGKETYLCQDYRGIIMAKLKMILPKMKDHEELFKNCIEINFK